MLADPDVLAGASGSLRALAAQLDETGRGIALRPGSVAAASWAGSAALAFEARLVETGRALSGAARELHEVAQATSRFAAQAAEAAAISRQAHARSAGEPDREGATGTGVGVPGEQWPSGPPAWWSAGAFTNCGLRVRAEAAELRRVLATTDPWAGMPAAWLEARERAGAAADLGSAAPVLAKLAPTAAYWSALTGPGTKSSVPVGVTVGSARRARMAGALDGLRGGAPVPGLSQVPPTVLTAVRRLSLAAGTVDAAGEALIGDPAHPGWRDAVTRAAGAAGALGGGALLLGVSSPIGAGVAAAAVTGYGLWKLGTAIWDHRHTLAKAWRGVVDSGRDLVLRGVGRVRLAASRAGDDVRAAVARLSDATNRVSSGTQEALHAARTDLDTAGARLSTVWHDVTRAAQTAPDAPFGAG